MRVVADSGGIIAAINSAEPDHDAYLLVLESAATAFVTPLVVTEVHHLLMAAGLAAAADGFLEDVIGGFYELVNPTVADVEVAGELVRRYRGSMQSKPGSLDLADAMNIVVAGAKATNLIVATDQDYRRVVPLSGHPAFALLPQDLASHAPR
ncbi:MAG: PIN domain-containing protein [Tessaracoccus sp.]